MTKQRSYSPVEYVIKDISRVTHDTKRFIFELPLDTMLDFLPGDHLHMHYLFDGEEIERPYTPSSTPDDNGFFEMIIKRYPTGIMSGYVHGLKIGDKVRLSGPFAGGHYQLGMPMKVGMVAGGAGITPMISIIRTALRRNYDINISLVFANKTENDIILRSEFETLAAAHGNFKVLFALDQPPASWSGHSGFIDEVLLAKHLFAHGDDSLVYLSGPPMMEFKIREALMKLGYGRKQVVIP